MFPILSIPKLCIHLFKMPLPQYTYTYLLRALLTLEAGGGGARLFSRKVEFSIDLVSPQASLPHLHPQSYSVHLTLLRGPNKSCSLLHLCEHAVVVLCT